MKQKILLIALIACTWFIAYTTGAVAQVGCTDPQQIDKTKWKLVYADSESIDAGDNNYGSATDAFDGNPDSYWRTLPDNAAPHPHEIIIDLGDFYALSTFVFQTRVGSTWGRVKGYELYVSNSSTSWDAIPTHTGEFLDNAAEQEASFEPVVGRFIKFKTLSSNHGEPFVCVGEIDFMGCIAEPEPYLIDKANWALVSADSESIDAGDNNYGLATDAFDGDPNSYWRTLPDNAAPHPHEIIIDLGDFYALSTIVFQSRISSTWGRVKGYELYVSNSSTTWDAIPVHTGEFLDNAALQEASFEPVVGRYIKFKTLSSNHGEPFVCVGEIDFMGFMADPEPYVIAKTKWKIASVDNEWIIYDDPNQNGLAKKLFDGDPNTLWHTFPDWAYPAPHEVVIDLGDIYELSTFVCQPRIDAAWGRVLAYELYISDSKTEWNTIPVVAGEFPIGDTSPQEVIFDPAEGRYIKFVVLSMQTDAPFTAVGELDFIGILREVIEPVEEEDPYISKANWVLIDVDSEFIDPEWPMDGGAANLFDDDPFTVWHTTFDSLTTQPHYVVIDLGDTYELNSFVYQPRIDSNWGRVKEYELFVTDNPEDPGNPVLAGEFDYSADLQTVALDQAKGRYIVFVTISAHDDQIYSVVGELDFVGKIAEYLDPVNQYSNDFNTTTNDFTGTDFGVSTPTDFSSPGLNSEHPYTVGASFSTVLRFPIILEDGGKMSFDEIALVEPGDAGSKLGDATFYDYVVVEGSKDGGTTWLPLVDAYSSNVDPSWLTLYNSSENAVPTEDLYMNREIIMTANGNFNAGDTILVQFRLFSDEGATGWGWIIDNLKIQDSETGINPILVSSGKVDLYPNPVTDQLNVQFKSLQSFNNMGVKIYNSAGIQVFSKIYSVAADTFESTIDMKSFNSGLYIISLKSDKGSVYNAKFLVK